MRNIQLTVYRNYYPGGELVLSKIHVRWLIHIGQRLMPQSLIQGS